MNNLMIIGNLTKDPELYTTQGGRSLCKFSLAVKRAYRNADGEYMTDYFDCVAFGATGENVARYQRKGNKMAVQGSVEINPYTDKNGVKRKATQISVLSCEFLPSPQRTDGDNDAPIARRKAQPDLAPFDDDGESPFQSKPTAKQQTMDDEFDDEVPF